MAPQDGDELVADGQILLRYGDACEVLEPPELVALFRKTARS